MLAHKNTSARLAVDRALELLATFGYVGGDPVQRGKCCVEFGVSLVLSAHAAGGRGQRALVELLGQHCP